jgi:peptidylprolyl isomerase
MIKTIMVFAFLLIFSLAVADDADTTKAVTKDKEATTSKTEMKAEEKTGDVKKDTEMMKEEEKEAEKKAEEAKEIKTESGLRYIVLKEGTGPKPQKGDMIKAHYTGWLMNGKKFDSSVDRGEPFKTQVGVGKLIKGWDEALLDMKVGEKRKLTVPGDLAYGKRGIPGLIPPDAALVFDVELLEIVK